MMNSVIQINGLTKKFPLDHQETILAVKNLMLEIQKGEMFGLVGPDGAGKTTTIRMLCGILHADEGEASVLGYRLVNQTDQIKKKIGYLSQQFSLYGDLSIDENIEFFAEIHGVENYTDRRDELLEFTRLKPFRDRLADKLSGGMKQKLALACTLIHRPEIIFLDEPTTGVDPVSRRDFWKILSNLLKQGITILMTTPYLDEAERCSRVGLMNKGEIMICDTPENIKKSLTGELVELTAEPIRRAYEICRQVPEVLEAQMFGDRLNLLFQNAKKGLGQVKEKLDEQNVRILDQRAIQPSLENIFISLMKKQNN